jgi:poly(A) polymerase
MSSYQKKLALDITRRLRDAGFEALWAGGCVRDQLLKRGPKDYDVATNARPEEVQKLFGKQRTLAIGAAFGVIGVKGRNCLPVEVATFRSDGAYLDGRHPSSIVFTTAEHDAQRRDFTINGMFFDPLAEQVIDYVGGQADLDARIIRAIGDPQARFTEDKLRMLRAVRFAATFDFALHAETQHAIVAMAPEITVVSAERINTELTRLLCHTNRKRGLELLDECGLLAVLFPELADAATTNSPAWRVSLDTLAKLQSDNIATAITATLYSFHDVVTPAEWARRYRFSNKEIELAQWLSTQLPRIATAENLPWPALQRILVHEGAGELLALARAVLGEDSAGLLRAEQAAAMPLEVLNPPPLVTGDDLIQEGFQPGPHFGGLLTSLRDAQLDGEITTQTEAFELARRLLSKQPPGER